MNVIRAAHIHSKLFIEVGVMDEAGGTVWPPKFKVLTYVFDEEAIPDVLEEARNHGETVTGIRTSITPVEEDE